LENIDLKGFLLTLVGW